MDTRENKEHKARTTTLRLQSPSSSLSLLPRRRCHALLLFIILGCLSFIIFSSSQRSNLFTLLQKGSAFSNFSFSHKNSKNTNVHFNRNMNTRYKNGNSNLNKAVGNFGGGGGGGGEGGGGGGAEGREEWMERQELVRQLVTKYKVDFYADLAPNETRSPWKVAEDWVTDREVLPEDAPQLGAVLHALSTYAIETVENNFEGTQLKLILTLAGGQQVVFKPKWHERDHILTGIPASGRDRHNGEVAAFHLSRILEFRRSPLVVGRTISLSTDLIPSVPPDLLDTFYKEDGKTCFYGKCTYCHKENALCTPGDSFEGAIILWLPRHVHLTEGRNMWRHSVKEHMVRSQQWERDEPYCKVVKQESDLFNDATFMLDFIDVTVFDYIISNPDRHHYEYVDNMEKGMVVMLDNGKSFGNPYQDYQSLLEPLEDCCVIRRSTWKRLQLVQHNVLSNVLREVLRDEPLHPVLTEPHLQAIDRRLLKVLQDVEKCIEAKGQNSVLRSD